MSGRFLSKVGGFPLGVRAAEYGLRMIYVVLATSRDRFPYKNEKARLCCDPLAQWSDGVVLVASSQYQSFDSWVKDVHASSRTKNGLFRYLFTSTLLLYYDKALCTETHTRNCTSLLSGK
jgi:hypothetical protein